MPCFSRTLRHQVFASKLDWFTALCMKSVFGQTDLFNFDFKALD